jgi:hypothetical protein
MFYGIVDKNRKIIFSDRKAYEEILGIPSSLPVKEIEEFWINNIVHPDDRKEQELYFRRNFANAPLVRQYRINHPRKGLRWIRTTTSIYLDNFMSFSEDITEEKLKKKM